MQIYDYMRGLRGARSDARSLHLKYVHIVFGNNEYRCPTARYHQVENHMKARNAGMVNVAEAHIVSCACKILCLKLPDR